jgi:hypothetical protein
MEETCLSILMLASVQTREKEYSHHGHTEDNKEKLLIVNEYTMISISFKLNVLQIFMKSSRCQ